MCRREEGAGHVGVVLRKGCYADRQDDGSVILCEHPHGDINLPSHEIVLSPADLAIVGLLAVVIEDRPATQSETLAQNTVVSVEITEFEPDDMIPEAKPIKPPVRTKPAVTPSKAPSKKVKH